MASSDLKKLFHRFQDIKDPSRLLKVLMEVRKRVDWPKDKDQIDELRHTGCLKLIVTSLDVSKKYVVDVTLSILGNCCLDSKCANDVVSQFALLPGLNQVLKRYPEEDSINGRVFRIIGNLCQHRDQWATTIIEKKPQIVIHIVKFLKKVAEDDTSNISEGTVIMGVRALRELLNRETLIRLVDTFRALKVVGMLLIKYGNKWKEDKKGASVVVNIIKLLLEYSSYRYYPMITEMKTTEKGDSIILLSKVVMLAPKQVVKIIMNFLRISQLNSELPVSEIFDVFLDVLRNEATLGQFTVTYEECIKCVCQLLEDPGTRSTEKSREIIFLLIDLLHQTSLESKSRIGCCILLVTTLIKYKYDEKLLEEQVKCNVVGVVVEKLELIVGSSKSLTVSHKKITDVFSKFAQIFSGSVEQYLRDFRSSDNASPVSSDGETAMSWTAGLSPEPSGLARFSLPESDSDDYSPVCSEIDANEFPLSFPEDDVEEIHCFDFSDKSEVAVTMMGLKRKLIVQLAVLLKIIVKLQPFVNQLRSIELITALVKCSALFDSYNAQPIVDVIPQIMDSPGCLLMIMQTDFPMLLRELMFLKHGKHCLKCLDLQKIANSVHLKLTDLMLSGPAKGDVAHALLRGSDNVKQQLVLSIPYVVRPQFLLAEFMCDCQGLVIFMALLREVSPVQIRGIKALCVLPEADIVVPKPKIDYSYSCLDDNAFRPRPTLDSSEAITFKLDDGSSVKANRSRLAEISDFFSRLFHGDFNESGADEIALHNVLNKSFQWLLKLDNLNISNGNILQLDVDLMTQLDVLVLCDRFLMTDHSSYLTKSVSKFYLNVGNIVTIYKWSIESGLALFRTDCICLALLASEYSKRVEVFKALFGLGHTNELVENIKEVLVKCLLNYKITEKRKRRFETGLFQYPKEGKKTCF